MPFDYVPAHYDYGRRTRPALALILHMAEGGNTVAYLAKPNPNKVSVHYVVERTGRIVQMLGEDRISGSIRPTDIRRTDDPPYTMGDGTVVVYGATAAKAALERYWSDPNTVVLSCEIEGFAAQGPSAAALAGLRELVADIRTRYPDIALLGHRDFADYKRCPGTLIPWGPLGGHGVPLPDTDTGGDDMQIIVKAEDWQAVDGNGVLRTTPDRGAPIAARMLDGRVIRSIAEVYTRQPGTPDYNSHGNWRLTRDGDGQTLYMLRVDWEPVTPGGDPAVDFDLGEFIARDLSSATDVGAYDDGWNDGRDAVLKAGAAVPRR